MEEHLHLCFGVVAKVLDLCSRKSVTDQQLITGLFDCFSSQRRCGVVPKSSCGKYINCLRNDPITGNVDASSVFLQELTEKVDQLAKHKQGDVLSESKIRAPTQESLGTRLPGGKRPVPWCLVGKRKRMAQTVLFFCIFKL